MTVCDYAQKELWDALIGDTDDIYYRWSYADCFFKAGDGRPTLLYLTDGQTRVYNVVMLREIADVTGFEDLRSAGLRDMATPYGYGGVVVSGKPNADLLDRFFRQEDDFCQARNVVSEFVRLDPVSGNAAHYAARPYESSVLTQTVCIRLQSEEQVWDGMKSECRNRIRKAMKSGVSVTSGFSESDMRTFRRIYCETMMQNRADRYYFFSDAFFDSVLEMRNHAKIYIAWHENLPVSAILVIFSGGNACYHLGGSLKEHRGTCANNLLFYGAIKDLLPLKIKTLQLGGGYAGATDSLFQYKKSFCPGGVRDCFVAKRIYDAEAYGRLVALRNARAPVGAGKSGFFPAYRA